jgi:hypothetical protein
VAPGQVQPIAVVARVIEEPQRTQSRAFAYLPLALTDIRFVEFIRNAALPD